jgi:hypothetical protein
MKIQKLYLAAGLIWGLVLGPDAGLAAAGVMGRVAWLYTFQDGAWASWFIGGFGIFIGLFVLTVCVQVGAFGGRRYDFTSEKRRKHVKAIPWTLMVLGFCVGAIAYLTIEDRRAAVFLYLQKQQAAADQLLEMARNRHRISDYAIGWPGGNENGRLVLSFEGNHRREYFFEWGIFKKEGKEPLLGDKYQIRLNNDRKNTDIPLSPVQLGNAWLKQTKNPQQNVDLEEPFRLVMKLTPVLRKEDWEQLPDDEEFRLKEGESILIREINYEFKLKMRFRGGRVEWLTQ